VRVALLQLRARAADEDDALREGERAFREAAALGADVALFPEMWQIGYAAAPPDPEGRTAWLARAVPADGAFVGRFRALARELRTAVVITYLERRDGAPRNVATLIDREGRDVLTHAKVHTCDFGFERVLAPGDAFRAADLDLPSGRVRVGMMICFDREFPESARALMLAGAEVILTPNACSMDAERIGQLRARAFENMVGVALANYAVPEPPGAGACDGHSIAFSGICYGPDGRARDHTLVAAGEGPGIHLAAFDLDALRAYRAREPWGGAFRRPPAYGALLDVASDPVFARAAPRDGPQAPVS
jgi:N-carbamoylputrescine amidase